MSGKMQGMDLKQWIEEGFGTTINGAAVAAGIQPPTLFRQIKNGRISADNVIALCHAHDKPVPDGLVETGICSWDDFKMAGIEDSLDAATNAQLITQMAKRLEVGEGYEFNEPATVVDFGEYAADSSPVEPEPGDEGYHDGP